MSDNDYNYLCLACGEISPFSKWMLLKRAETGELIANPPGESDPICRCPVCRWDHRDDDGNPGIHDGTREHLVIERKLNEPDFTEAWADRRRHVTDTAFWELFRAARSRVHTVAAFFADFELDQVSGYEILHVSGDQARRQQVNLREDGSLVLVYP